MVKKHYLCRCNMCETIMFDENPGENSVLIDVTPIEKPINCMVQFHDRGEFYWGCPNCSTDSYLMDITNYEVNSDKYYAKRFDTYEEALEDGLKVKHD